MPNRSRSLIFVVNQWAGHCDAFTVIEKSQRFLPDWQCDFRFPISREEIRECCDDLSPKQYDAVVLVGGDGTVNSALPGLLGKDIPIYVFPAGSENDLAQTLGSRGDWAQLRQAIEENAPSAIDVVMVNGVPFATVGGIGIGTVLIDERNRSRGSATLLRTVADSLGTGFGGLIAARAVLLRNDYLHRVRISVPGESRDFLTPAALICNQPTVGGIFHAAPGARNDDGLLDLVVFRNDGKKELLRTLYALRSGAQPPGVLRALSVELSIESLENKALSLFADGEILLSSQTLHFRVQPLAIKFFGQHRQPQSEKRGDSLFKSA